MSTTLPFEISWLFFSLSIYFFIFYLSFSLSFFLFLTFQSHNQHLQSLLRVTSEKRVIWILCKNFFIKKCSLGNKMYFGGWSIVYSIFSWKHLQFFIPKKIIYQISPGSSSSGAHLPMGPSMIGISMFPTLNQKCNNYFNTLQAK